MNEKKTFNQNKYIQEWKKEHNIKKWTAEIEEEKKIKLDQLIKEKDK